MSGDSVEIRRDGIKVQGRDVNLFFTVVGAVAAIVAAALTVENGIQAREVSFALVAALKEQTLALRENTCVTTYRGPVESRAEDCKRQSKL